MPAQIKIASIFGMQRLKIMIKLGILGYPLGHSLSKVMHEAVMKELGLQGTYDILETEPEDLIQKVKDIKRFGYQGFNVTIPFKVPMTMMIDDFDDLANIAGCVNTVKVLPDKSLKGFNTDVYGFKAAFSAEQNKLISGKKASIIGTGGAARAAAIGLCSLGISEIDFYTRNIVNASNMVNFLRSQFLTVRFNLKQIQSLADLSDTYILVNASPIGMRGKAMDLMPVEPKVLKTMPLTAIVYDIVYNPRKTLLIKSANECGLETIDGCEMLIHQGAKAFEIWTGQKPPISVMKIALLDSLAK